MEREGTDRACKKSSYSMRLSLSYNTQKEMAEVARNHSSLPFGYDEAFVNPVDEGFLCPIRHLPAKEPIQTSCDHRFCEECINEYLQRYVLNVRIFSMNVTWGLKDKCRSNVTPKI